MADDFTSTVEIEDAVYVHIAGTREVESDDLPRFEMAGDDLAKRFLTWLMDNDVPQFRGGSVGLGSFTGWFPASERKRIESFFQHEGFSGYGVMPRTVIAIRYARGDGGYGPIQYVGLSDEQTRYATSKRKDVKVVGRPEDRCGFPTGAGWGPSVCGEKVPCDEHKALTCGDCGAPATHFCSNAGSLVCGRPQCDQHRECRRHG